MLGDLFDSPWKILIVAVVLIVLFGSKKLPDAARSLGKSMRILKTEVQDLHGHDEAAGAPTAAPPIAQPSQPPVDAPQQQANDLLRNPAAAEHRSASPASVTETQHSPAG